tara:strand:- start:107 stop:865 length:759 start_codon:yes stop_codon:yes gene_type:complete
MRDVAGLNPREKMAYAILSKMDITATIVLAVTILMVMGVSSDSSILVSLLLFVNFPLVILTGFAGAVYSWVGGDRYDSWILCLAGPFFISMIVLVSAAIAFLDVGAGTGIILGIGTSFVVVGLITYILYRWLKPFFVRAFRAINHHMLHQLQIMAADYQNEPEIVKSVKGLEHESELTQSPKDFLRRTYRITDRVRFANMRRAAIKQIEDEFPHDPQAQNYKKKLEQAPLTDMYSLVGAWEGYAKVSIATKT